MLRVCTREPTHHKRLAAGVLTILWAIDRYKSMPLYNCLNHPSNHTTLSNATVTRCNPPGIKIDIMAKRCVICHLKAWTLLIIVA